MPTQRAPLDPRHREMDGHAEEAGGERVGVQVLVQSVRRRLVHFLTEPGDTHEQLRGEGEDQRHRRGDPKARAVSTATGSTSWTPYIVWISSGQNAPNAARKTSLFSVVPSVRNSTGISAADGIGRRNSIGTRNARAAKSLVPSTIPIGTASAVATARPSAHPRTVWKNAVQKASVCMKSQSFENVVLAAGRSVSEISPLFDRSSQIRSEATIEPMETRATARRSNGNMFRARGTSEARTAVTTSPRVAMAVMYIASDADVRYENI